MYSASSWVFSRTTLAVRVFDIYLLTSCRAKALSFLCTSATDVTVDYYRDGNGEIRQFSTVMFRSLTFSSAAARTCQRRPSLLLCHREMSSTCVGLHLKYVSFVRLQIRMCQQISLKIHKYAIGVNQCYSVRTETTRSVAFCKWFAKAYEK